MYLVYYELLKSNETITEFKKICFNQYPRHDGQQFNKEIKETLEDGWCTENINAVEPSTLILEYSQELDFYPSIVWCFLDKD